MTARQSPLAPPKKRALHPYTVLRVAITAPDGKHVTQLTITTASGEHRVRLLPRMVRQLASPLNSVADKYDRQREAGGAP
jgi:hypothetical protein